MKDLRDKVVVLTGGGAGIGRATSEAFADAGSRVVVSDIDGPAADEVAQSIKSSGGEAISLSADVSKEDDVTALVSQTLESFGALDVMVNNAGVMVSGPAELTSIEDWRWVDEINVWPHVYAVRAALPIFKKQGSGHLVHVASAAGILGSPGLAAYCLTKFAVFGLAESLAVTLHGSGIGVSVVCPLWVRTGLVDNMRLNPDPGLSMETEDVRALGQDFLQSSGSSPEEVASAIVDGVRSERFLILPHPEVLKYAQIKWSDPEKYIMRAAEALKEQQRFFGESRSN